MENRITSYNVCYPTLVRSEQNIQLLNKVANLVDNALVTTREIANKLTPHILERYGLKKAIDTFVRNIVVITSYSIHYTKLYE